MRCSVLQCVAVCCSGRIYCDSRSHRVSVLQCVAVGVLQSVAELLQSVAVGGINVILKAIGYVYCSVLQCGAECCGVYQCVEVC